ncbi:helix-turn-helix domain-containing protein [Brucella pseudogrignonensis]|uniref:helix-turn-helix domain-containing protein n=1 Tax=Brucella pseudogrignonensis TaxID=419475 RepID=UPI001EDC73F4|nr:helix-turn-helix domain-containing protein [Brucella pseudogrignonensis]UKK92062.1 helix-turn-helix domain-containing protein [Brucella pseudogrignonensis]
MDKVQPINFFAAIPGRASRDERLTGLHFRVLCTVAGHDRMGRNGQCCWAGRDTLARLVGCNPSRLSSAVSELIDLGYLEEHRHEDDGRRKGYRVVYLIDQDAAGIGSKLKEDRLPDGNVSHSNRLRNGNLNRGRNRLPNGNVNTDENSLRNSDLSQANRLRDGNVNQGDRLRKSNLNEAEKRLKTVVNQSVRRFADKPNILSRNLNISSEAASRGIEKRKIREFEKAQNALVKALGERGWTVLAAIAEDERERLLERVLDGEDEQEIARTLIASERLAANAQAGS